MEEMTKRKIRCKIRFSFGLIFGLVFTFFDYFALYLLLSLIMSKLASIIVASAFFGLVLIISLLVLFGQNTILSQFEIEDQEKREILSTKFQELFEKAYAYNPRLKKTRIIFTNSNDSILDKYAFGSPGVAAFNSIMITDCTSKKDELKCFGIIAHELGHIDSCFTLLMSVVCLINFAYVYLPRVLFMIAQRLMQSRLQKVLKKVLFTFFYLLSFITALPYNLVFAFLHIGEEKDADKFACLLGYGYSLKYFFSECENPFIAELSTFLILPLHPFTHQRTVSVNRCMGYSDNMCYYHIVDDTLFCYNGTEKEVAFDAKNIGLGFPVINKICVTNVKLGINVRSINKKAFFLNNKLVDIQSESPNLIIYDLAFGGCVALKRFNTVKASIKTVLSNSFYGCLSLNELDLTGCVKVGERAFYESGITNLDTSDCLQEVGYNAFAQTKIAYTYDAFKNRYFKDWLIDCLDSQGFLKITNDTLFAEKIPCHDLFIDVSETDINTDKIRSVFSGNIVLLGRDYLLADYKDYIILRTKEEMVDIAIEKLKLASDFIECYSVLREINEN